MMLDVTAEEADLQAALPMAEIVENALYAMADATNGFTLRPVRKNEGFSTAGQVQFVCRAGDYRKKGIAYTGALRVLRVIMGYDYLWTRIRVKGGAYGCMSSFSRDGSAMFVSYRDPHLQQSIDVYEEAADYVGAFEADERTMTKYIIGAVGAMDHPLTPSQFGRYCLAGYLSGMTDEDNQRERDEVLGAQPEDIRKLADLIRAFMQDENLCVIGSAEKIAQHKELFETTSKLF